MDKIVCVKKSGVGGETDISWEYKKWVQLTKDAKGKKKKCKRNTDKDNQSVKVCLNWLDPESMQVLQVLRYGQTVEKAF